MGIKENYKRMGLLPLAGPISMRDKLILSQSPRVLAEEPLCDELCGNEKIEETLGVSKGTPVSPVDDEPKLSSLVNTIPNSFFTKTGLVDSCIKGTAIDLDMMLEKAEALAVSASSTAPSNISVADRSMAIAHISERLLEMREAILKLERIRFTLMQ